MTNLNDYGFDTFFQAQVPDGSPDCPARVSAVHKERYEIAGEQCIAFARLKTGVYHNGGTEAFPTVGDFVLVQHNSGGDSQIVKTLARKTYFSRRDPDRGRGEQAVAANFDYVFILQSLNHDFNTSRLERYITLAWQSGALPVVLLTKADLVEDCSTQLRTAERLAIGTAVMAVSAATGAGLNNLADYLLPGKTIVLLGSSGVGKSSLVNALFGQAVMAVNTIREDDSRGRHTTTHRQLIRLPGGALLIDTPGMRELGMWEASTGLGEAFGDVEAYFGHCKFADCHHETEPGCAVQKAIDDGTLSAKRWQSYLQLKREALYFEDRAAAMRAKQQRHKALARSTKEKRR